MTSTCFQEVSPEARHFGLLWRMTSRVAEIGHPSVHCRNGSRSFRLLSDEHLFEDNEGGARDRARRSAEAAGATVRVFEILSDETSHEAVAARAMSAL